MVVKGKDRKRGRKVQRWREEGGKEQRKGKGEGKGEGKGKDGGEREKEMSWRSISMTNQSNSSRESAQDLFIGRVPEKANFKRQEKLDFFSAREQWAGFGSKWA